VNCPALKIEFLLRIRKKAMSFRGSAIPRMPPVIMFLLPDTLTDLI
jgi:hypothetical protein